jgi:hypothetical protein
MVEFLSKSGLEMSSFGWYSDPMLFSSFFSNSVERTYRAIPGLEWIETTFPEFVLTYAYTSCTLFPFPPFSLY